MPKMVPLKSAMVLTLAVALLAFSRARTIRPSQPRPRPRLRLRSNGRCKAPGRQRLSSRTLRSCWWRPIEKNAGGRLKLELSPAGAVVPPFEIQDAVNRGVLDAGHTTPGYIIGAEGLHPLTHGPLFGMDFIDYYGWYWDGGGTSCSMRPISSA